VPPRPNSIVLAALALACAVVACLIAPHPAMPATSAAASSSPRAVPWRWPLRGAVVGAFRLTPGAPFARGQRRGIDLAASPGTTVRAACPGRVTFAGPLPRQGLAVTVRCGTFVATYLRLGRLSARSGVRVGSGERLGALGPAGRLRLGARRAADRRGYVDPLLLLRDPGTSAPPLTAPPPHGRRPRLPAPTPPVGFAAPQPRSAVQRLPWPAYPAVALIATAFPVGGLVHRRRRRRAATLAAIVDIG
jgi:peptidase M23-like protein